MIPDLHKAYITPIDTTPLTIITPPNAINADRSGIRVNEVHTQK
jgi:hypothetical protein